MGYPLILGWNKGWLPIPAGEAAASLKDGRVLQCRLADRTQRTMYLGLFEPAETRLLRDLLRPGDTFVDVGAHIGWFTTIAADCVGGTGRVLAFEPYPANAEMLRKNLTHNHHVNVKVIESALGSRAGSLPLALGNNDSGGVTALDWAHEGRTTVPMTTLDTVTGELREVTLLKIDVEGWEAHVLQGAERTLAHTKSVMIEINRPALAKAGTSPEEIYAILRSAGFTDFLPLVETGLRRLHRESSVSNVLATRSAIV